MALFFSFFLFFFFSSFPPLFLFSSFFLDFRLVLLIYFSHFKKQYRSRALTIVELTVHLCHPDRDPYPVIPTGRSNEGSPCRLLRSPTLFEMTI